MKALGFISMMLLLLTSCAGKIETNIPKAIVKQTEKLTVDVFSLTFHKQVGTCASQPITHRVLLFSYVPLAPNNGDYYAGDLEVLLDDQTGTYKALYRELPGINNIDQSQFQTVINGSFEIIKATSATANDKMILHNLGVLNPAIKGSSINFFITLDADINRAVTRNEVLGSVRFQSTSLIADNCLL